MNKTLGQSKVLRRRPLIAGSLLALFLFVLAMAQFETLHQACHAEAEQAGHHCIVTTLNSGMVDAPATETPVVLPPALAIGERISEICFVPSVDYLLLPSRGPPALSA